MKNKNIYIIVAIVVVAVVILIIKSDGVSSVLEKTETQNEIANTDNDGPKSAQTVKVEQKSTVNVVAKESTTNSSFPIIDFIDKRVLFKLDDFSDVKITVQKVVFGRGEATTSTGCSGIPNTNFSTYLYPGSGICISQSEVDGSPRGIVAFHILVENNGNVAFGGNVDTLKLHYLRSDSTGTPTYRFAHSISSLASYYINGYSSREIILSYLVPEDQLVFNFISGYKEPALENKTLNVYDFSVNGLLVDFSSKDIKIVK